MRRGLRQGSDFSEKEAAHAKINCESHSMPKVTIQPLNLTIGAEKGVTPVEAAWRHDLYWPPHNQRLTTAI